MHCIIKEKAQNLSLVPGSMKYFQCAFFNASGGPNQTGGWFYSGLKTEIINDTHVRCSASHLTTFVILVSLIPEAEENPVSLNTCCTYYLYTYSAVHAATDMCLYSSHSMEHSLLLAACAGLHHIHWLQHFSPLLDCLHHILFDIEVSLISTMNHNESMFTLHNQNLLYYSSVMQSFHVLLCRKELIQKLHNFVHLNLCIALSLGLLFFLTGIQTATANIVSDRTS